MPNPSGWFGRCHVLWAGQAAQDDIVIITLQDTANPPGFQGSVQFVAHPTKSREMLATALAAITSGLKVGADIVSAEPRSRIISLYLMSPDA